MHIQLLLPLALLPLQIFSLPVPQPQEQGLNPLPNDSDFATKSVNGVITAFGSSGKKAKRGRRTKVRRVAIVDSDVVLEERQENPIPNDSDFPTKVVNGEIVPFKKEKRQENPIPNDSDFPTKVVNGEIVPFKKEKRQENPIPNDSDFPTKVVNGEIVPFKKEKRQENPIPNDSDFPTKVVNGEIVPFKKEKRQENPIPNDSDFPTKVVNGEIVPFIKEKRQENPIPNDSDFPTKVVNGEIVPFKKEKRQENPIPNDSDFATKVVNGEIVPFSKRQVPIDEAELNAILAERTEAERRSLAGVGGVKAPLSSGERKMRRKSLQKEEKVKREENPIPNDSDFATKVVNGEIVPFKFTREK